MIKIFRFFTGLSIISLLLSGCMKQKRGDDASSIYEDNLYIIDFDLRGGHSESYKGIVTVESFSKDIFFFDCEKENNAFRGWEYNYQKIFDENGNQLNEPVLSKQMTFIASWEITNCDLIVRTDDDSKGTATIVEGSGIVGETVIVEANAKSGFVFEGWYQYGNRISDDAIYSFTMPSNNTSLNAVFISVEEAQNIALGATPYIDAQEKTISYGLYPQRIVDDIELLNSLNALKKTSVNKSNNWYLYENTYYAKLSADKVSTEWADNHGNQNVYWFKCEPIVWKILSKSNGTYSLISNIILDVCKFDSNYEWNYEHSEIRAWLNGYNASEYNLPDFTGVGFVNTAFALNNEHIATTDVDNSAWTTNLIREDGFWCNDTRDNAYVLSYSEYTDSRYGFSKSEEPTETRCCDATDWARAQSSFYYVYWTRTTDQRTRPGGTGGAGTKYCQPVFTVLGTSGSIDGSRSDYPFGVRPAITFTTLK